MTVQEQETFQLRIGETGKLNKRTILISLNHPFQLKIGQTAHLEERNLAITPVKVIEDSRCPQGTPKDPGPMCYWSGQVTVLFEIQEGSDLPTSLKISSHKKGFFEDLAIGFHEVTPTKYLSKPETNIATIPIAPTDYTFTLQIERLRDRT